MMQTSRRVVIAVLGGTQILAWGSSYYLLAVLAAPIAADTGWPLAWIVGALSAGLLVAGLISPRVGHAIGQHGGRPVLAASALLLALGLTGLALAPSLIVFVAGWLVIGAGMGCGLYDAAFATLGVLYGAKARPAISMLTLWGGFASTVCWPFSAYLVAQLGWRGACLAYAGIQLGVSLPLVWLLLPRTVPAPVGVAANSAAAPLKGAERRAFGLLAAVLVLGGTITSVVSVHLLTLLQARGLPLAATVALGALIGPAQVAARVVEMMGGGRHHPRWTLLAAMGLIAAGLVLLWAGIPAVALALILYGAGNGVYSIARGTLPLALFGPERYPALMGRLGRPNLAAQALAPSLGALVLDRYGAGASLGVLAGLGLINVLLVIILWNTTRPLTPSGGPCR